MRPLLRYITLLLVSGVIIPICTYTCTVEPDVIVMPKNKTMIDDPIKQEGRFHFYFVHDVAAKLLPVLTFFK